MSSQNDITGYGATKKWFDWSFQNPELIKPIHGALYLFAIHHCNTLSWKRKFGLPTTYTMEHIGVKSYNTYIKAFNDLVDWGFFIIHQRSKNQFTANIIEVSNFDKAQVKATSKHKLKQGESTSESTSSIDKPINYKTFKLENEIKKRAYSFILENKQSELEGFAMQNPKFWKNKEQLKKCILNFNDKMDQEISQGKIEFDPNQLMPRFKMYCRSWIDNIEKFTPKAESYESGKLNRF